ncbi:hypothetical protein AAFF_G00193080 [Aldrovandia affinis]|uniref:Uncharacterized protein n=1 Tax=Aldrovandia affinis TaxID=143900 RepID=A0AAD7RJN8_9TELE|nr:hypothetical protein AAFF_G00193080 [Aldrovandia affinis]
MLLHHVETAAPLHQLSTIIRINVYTRFFIAQFLLFSGNAQDLNFVLKVEEFNQDGPRLGSIISPGGRATVSPFNDRWLRKVVSPEKLLNQEGHEADDIAAFRRFRNLYEAEI